MKNPEAKNLVSLSFKAILYITRVKFVAGYLNTALGKVQYFCSTKAIFSFGVDQIQE